MINIDEYRMNFYSIITKNLNYVDFIYYKGIKQYTYEEFKTYEKTMKTDKDKIIGYIHCMETNKNMHENNYNIRKKIKILHVIMIFINVECRGMGLGNELLNYFIDYSVKNNIHSIHLDDMSDRYRHKNNLYIKNKFKYIDKIGPEMILYIDKSIRH